MVSKVSLTPMSGIWTWDREAMNRVCTTASLVSTTPVLCLSLAVSSLHTVSLCSKRLISESSSLLSFSHSSLDDWRTFISLSRARTFSISCWAVVIKEILSITKKHVTRFSRNSIEKRLSCWITCLVNSSLRNSTAHTEYLVNSSLRNSSVHTECLVNSSLRNSTAQLCRYPCRGCVSRNWMPIGAYERISALLSDFYCKWLRIFSTWNTKGVNWQRQI